MATWAGLKLHLMLTQRHDGSQANSTSLLLSSVSASSFPDGDVQNARTRSLPVSSAAPLGEKEQKVSYVYAFSGSSLGQD